MKKFKVGDIVIGNELATEEYTVTVEGYKAQVLEFNDDTMYILGVDDHETWWVDAKCFDLVEEKTKKKEPKFKVGDTVIGNKLANDYGITIEGWKGKVVEIDEDDTDSEDDICVKGLHDREKYWVDSKCFDLYTEKKSSSKTKPEPDSVSVSEDFIKEIYDMVDDDVKEMLEEKFGKFLEKPEFEFGNEYTITPSSTGPLMIGQGMAPKGLEGHCLVVKNGYDLEVRQEGHNKVLIFREQK
jgi:hypothetical protein